MAGRSEQSATKSSSLIAAILAHRIARPALRNHQRSTEGLLHRHLLIEHHADQQCVVVFGQQAVGFRISCQPDGGVGHGVIVPPPGDSTPTGGRVRYRRGAHFPKLHPDKSWCWHDQAT